MCGIVCAFDLKQSSDQLRPQVLDMAKQIRHRGPDWSGVYSDEKAILAPLEEIEGLAANTEVWGTGEPHRIHVGRSLIGRVIDGLGRPIDRQPFDTEGMDQVKITPPVSDALDRPVIDDIFQTGVKSIDGFNTVGQGQRLAIFGEAGSGKSTLLAMLARHSETDVVVLAMIIILDEFVVHDWCRDCVEFSAPNPHNKQNFRVLHCQLFCDIMMLLQDN